MRYIQPLDFSASGDGQPLFGGGWSAIFSVKIAGDSTHVLAGLSGGSLRLLNVERGHVTTNIRGHTNDVNNVTFVNRTSNSLFLSGSDDRLIKLWDVRLLGSTNKPAGVFAGHYCGITALESREDDVYFISNSKDQTLKLWDLRMFHTPENVPRIRGINFDYRFQRLDEALIRSLHNEFEDPDLKNKCKYLQVMTGHRVYGTLIRCHFSPKESTDQRFVYSGGADGRVHVWDILTGEEVTRLSPEGHHALIRDCAWHPSSPVLFAGDLEGMIHRWSFNYNHLTQTQAD
eukprot:TRINITY_DN12120_c0_g2_i1.p1 TRINITY_DN12120_c0_g2~~TRINITY_DN12120_c0_g2_i1.p1  ORF type:complete len:288 (+),score=50.28 TRINITY_DN12120_c0_g2_i1:597-1460(+)